jgi:F-type H+/Na+-transporting ATPase subunit beta
MAKTKDMTKAKDGKIIAVVGVVIDVEFAVGTALPAIYDALHVDNDGQTITLEVAQHLDEHTVRTIALSGTDGLGRGQTVTATGAPISVPVGEQTLGRMFNVTGEPIDEKPAPKAKTAPIHKNPPALTEQSNKAEILET